GIRRRRARRQAAAADARRRDRGDADRHRRDRVAAHPEDGRALGAVTAAGPGADESRLRPYLLGQLPSDLGLATRRRGALDALGELCALNVTLGGSRCRNGTLLFGAGLP